jgi:O-antigen ligase
MKEKITIKILYWLVAALLLVPFVFWKEMWYPFQTPKVLFFQAIIELALPFYLYLIIFYKHLRPNPKNPITISILLFFVVSFLSSVLGVNPSLSIWGNFLRMDGVFNLAHIVLFYFYILLLGKIDKRLGEKLLKTILGAAILMAAYGVWSSLGFPTLFVDRFLPTRVSATMANPIFFASFLIIPVFFALILAFRSQVRLYKMLCFAFALLLFLGIYVSGTRSCLLGFAVGLFVAAVVYLFNTKNPKLKIYSGLCATILVVIVGLLFLFHSKLPEGSLISRVTETSDINSKARVIQWQTALKGFSDRPFLGSGPQTYYLTANKYFNPEIYNYDSSFWDKPHNSLLEILITTGVLGLAAYLAILFFTVRSLFKSYKSNSLSLPEFCLFLGAIIAYQFQNLFGFDTVSAVLVFFCLLAVTCLKTEPLAEVSSVEPVVNPSRKLALGLMFVAILPVITAANIIPGMILYDLNQVVLAQPSDNLPQAYNYLEKAQKLPFDFDKSELASVLKIYSVKAIQSKDESGDKTLSDTIDLWQKLSEKTQNNPIYWLNLASTYLLQTKVYGTDNFEKIYSAAGRAVTLAPNRVEPDLVLMEAKIYDNKLSEAQGYLGRVLSLIPQNPNSDWHYKNKTEALRIMQGLAKKYDSLGNFASAIEIYKQGIQIDPQSILMYSGLATSYYKSGNKTLAIETARKILEFEPESEYQVNAFIKSFK